jgi:hypothetical protein
MQRNGPTDPAAKVAEPGVELRPVGYVLEGWISQRQTIAPKFIALSTAPLQNVLRILHCPAGKALRHHNLNSSRRSRMLNSSASQDNS